MKAAIKKEKQLADVWTDHAADWRDTAQICSHWREAAAIDPRLLDHRASKNWWPLLEKLGITLFITREYEHLAVALSVSKGRPSVTFFPVPHPSGLAVDRKRRQLYLASTRNPNQVYSFRPLSSILERKDVKLPVKTGVLPMMPATSAYYPGSLYIHDLALIGGRLYTNAVGHNAVARLSQGSFERVWWPRCVEIDGSPVFSRNHIQLNSIAAGTTLAQSFFSASSAKFGKLRPGHLKYPVDGRGVIFSGATREPVCNGLTRPHSARLRAGQIWVDNSGYGEVGFVRDGRLEVVCGLPGWTRGLSIIDRADTAFVGTSRIIPKFACYAPGLKPTSTICAIHAISCRTGEILATLEWPFGNQIFAIDWMPSDVTAGFLFEAPFRRNKRDTLFFYSYLNS